MKLKANLIEANKMKSENKSKIIGIIAIKGGVGKTTVVSNLGAVISNVFNKKVLLIDGNFSAPNLGIHTGIANTKHTIHHVLFDSVPIKNAIQDSGFGFDIIPGSIMPSKRHQKKVNPYKLTNRLEEIRNDYDYILIDSSPNLNEEMLATIICADNLYVVASPDYPTMSCTLRAIKTAQEKNTPISGLILNKVHNKKFELSNSEIKACTNIPIVAVMRHDIKFLESLSKTKPAYLHSPNRPVAKEYLKFGSLITNEDIPKTNMFSRFMSKLKK